MEANNPWYQYILDHPDRGWVFRLLSANPNITQETFEAYPEHQWFYKTVSANPSINWDFVKKYSSKQWSYAEMSKNPNVTIDIVNAHPTKKWDYQALSSNPAIIWQVIEDNPDRPWDYRSMSLNPNITWQIVEENLGQPWSFDNLATNPNITRGIMNAHPEHFAHSRGTFMINNFNASVGAILKQVNHNNPDAQRTSHIYAKHPRVKWNIIQQQPTWVDNGFVSQNPNINWTIVEENQGRLWHYGDLSQNPMKKHPYFQWLNRNNQQTYDYVLK
jgi:hypothetical protein